MSTGASSSLPQPSHANHGLLGGITHWIADLGDVVIRWIIGLGDVALFSIRTVRWMFTRAPRKDTLLPNFYQIGVLSLPVVALTGTFIGMVLAVQSYDQFKQMRLETRLGAIINMSLVRELGPVLAATMLAGRVGSAMAAELGTMRVTEQIDALGFDGRQSDLLPRRAAVSGLPAPDSHADGHGRFHGRGRRRVLQHWNFADRFALLLGELAAVCRRLGSVRGRFQKPVFRRGDCAGQLPPRLSLRSRGRRRRPGRHECVRRIRSC